MSRATAPRLIPHHKGETKPKFKEPDFLPDQLKDETGAAVPVAATEAKAQEWDLDDVREAEQSQYIVYFF